LFTWLHAFDTTGDERKDREVGIVRFSTGPIKVQGTWGGGGDPFCDGVATGIKGFRITSKDGVIMSLQVEYDICSQSCISRHGDYLAGNVDEVRFACYTSMALHLVLLMANSNY
jgi:hypothetical protein